MAFLVATTLLPAVYRPNNDARTTTAGTPHARAKIKWSFTKFQFQFELSLAQLSPSLFINVYWRTNQVSIEGEGGFSQMLTIRWHISGFPLSQQIFEWKEIFALLDI